MARAGRVHRAASLGAPLALVPVPTPASDPTTLVAGPDGDIWFVESRTNQVARLTP